MKSFDHIVSIMEHRKSQNSALLEDMLEVRRRYHADYVIPIPEMDDQPELPPLTPALVANAIDSPAMLASQVTPDIFCPPINFTKSKGRRSREYARKREHAVKSTWHHSKMRLQLYRSYRHLCGYATNYFIIRPNFRRAMPVIEVRDPLTAYPEPKAAEDVSRLGDCGFIHQRSASWLRQMYPGTRQEMGGPIAEPGKHEHELWDVIEWWDEEQVCWGILGPSYPEQSGFQSYHGSSGFGRSQYLMHREHRLGHCPAVGGARITLDRVATQVAHNTGIIDFMGRLLMLDMIAAERNVFPDRYMIGERGDIPRITSNGGNWADGRTGVTNILEGVRAVGDLRSQPDPMTRAAYDTLERNYKVSTGQTGMQMGENTSNLRTGRALSEIYGVAVDPRVMELQSIMEYALAEVNESILATWEAEWTDDKVILFAGFQGNRSLDEFRPGVHVEGKLDNAVTYTIAGADVQQTTIALGQLYGTDAISLDSMRRKHPYVDDPEVERRLVESERIERTMYESLMMRAQNGELPLTYLATVAQKVKEGVPIDEAVAAADEELREQQATAPEQPDPESGLAAPMEAMPGLEAAGPAAGAMAALGAGPEPAPTGPPIGPTDGQVGLEQLMAAMRGGGAA